MEDIISGNLKGKKKMQEIDNTSKHGNKPGFLGTPKQIIDKLILGFRPEKNIKIESKIIKIKESELKQIINNVLLKEEEQQNEYIEDEKALALMYFLNMEQNKEVGLIGLEKTPYDHYGLDTYQIEDGDEEWAIGTEKEINEAAESHIKEYAMSFNDDFIINHSSILNFNDKSVKKLLEIIRNEMDESGNEIILRFIDDIDRFIYDAIKADGRGSFIGQYDGIEHEYKLKDKWYYIYRLN